MGKAKTKSPLVYTVPLERLRADMLNVHIQLSTLLSKMRDLYRLLVEFYCEVAHEAGLLARLDALARELESLDQPSLAAVANWRAVLNELKEKVPPTLRSFSHVQASNQ
jgi:hypothetical protein